jgi:hypothetical protein
VNASKSKPLAIYGPRLRLSRGGRGSYSTPPKPGARPYFMMRHKDKLLDDCDTYRLGDDPATMWMFYIQGDARRRCSRAQRPSGYVRSP